MTTTAELVASIRAEGAKKARSDIESIGTTATKAGKATEKGLGSAETAVLGLAKKAAGLALGFFTVKKAMDTLVSSTLVASRVETLDVVLTNVGKNAGFASDEIAEYVKGVESMGITASVARGSLTKMAQANINLGQATKIARVAQDAAVIGQVNSSQALDRMIHGITTLNPLILRHMGILVNFEQEYEKWASANKRTASSLTQLEKQTIAANAVIKQGSKIAGTYESAMTTANKQMGSLEREVETLQVAIGEHLLPVFTEGIRLTRSWTRALTDLFKTDETASVDTLLERMKELKAELSFREGLGDKSQVRYLTQRIEELGGSIQGALERVGGPSGLRAQIQRVEDDIRDAEQAQADMLHPSSTGTMTVVLKGQADAYAGLTVKVGALRKELKQAQAELETVELDTPNKDDVDESRKDEANAAVHQKAMMRLDEKIQKIGISTALEQAQFDIMHGKYQQLDEDQKRDIANRAEQFDWAKKAYEAEESFKDTTFLDSLYTEKQTERDIEDAHYVELQNKILEHAMWKGETQDDTNAKLEVAQQQHEVKLTNIAKKEAKNRAKVEHDVSKQQVALRMGVLNQSVGFLKMLAGENEDAQRVVIALEKGLAIAQVEIDKEAAIWNMKATTPPYAWPALEGTIRSTARISQALIAATGLFQMGNMGGGGGASVTAPPEDLTDPTPDDTIFSNDRTTREDLGAIVIQVNGILTPEVVDDVLIPEIRDAVTDRDVILIDGNSRNAIDITTGAN